MWMSVGAVAVQSKAGREKAREKDRQTKRDRETCSVRERDREIKRERKRVTERDRDCWEKNKCIGCSVSNFFIAAGAGEIMYSK